MYDYNVSHEEGRSPQDIDDWTDSLDDARRIADDYQARTGTRPRITRYPMRQDAAGLWWTDTTEGEEVPA